MKSSSTVSIPPPARSLPAIRPMPNSLLAPARATWHLVPTANSPTSSAKSNPPSPPSPLIPKPPHSQRFKLSPRSPKTSLPPMTPPKSSSTPPANFSMPPTAAATASPSSPSTPQKEHSPPPAISPPQGKTPRNFALDPDRQFPPRRQSGVQQHRRLPHQPRDRRASPHRSTRPSPGPRRHRFRPGQLIHRRRANLASAHRCYVRPRLHFSR